MLITTFYVLINVRARSPRKTYRACHKASTRWVLQFPPSVLLRARCGICSRMPLGAISMGVIVPTESAPHVHTGCSPLHTMVVPRVQPVHLDGKSLPLRNRGRKDRNLLLLPLMHVCVGEKEEG